MNWSFSEKVRQGIIQHNRNNKSKDNTYVDQMFSKELTERRKLSLKHRKELIQNDKNSTFYVTYPAKLMKKTGNKTVIIKEY